MNTKNNNRFKDTENKIINATLLLIKKKIYIKQENFLKFAYISKK